MKKKVYTKEFKLEAVKLVLEQGLTKLQAAKDLGISDSTLGKWVRDYQSNALDAFPGKGSLRPQDEEIRTLKKELKTAQMERDILKKAISYFAKLEK